MIDFLYRALHAHCTALLLAAAASSLSHSDAFLLNSSLTHSPSLLSPSPLQSMASSSSAPRPPPLPSHSWTSLRWLSIRGDIPREPHLRRAMFSRWGKAMAAGVVVGMIAELGFIKGGWCKLFILILIVLVSCMTASLIHSSRDNQCCLLLAWLWAR